jgi:hypothetical protein
MATPSPLPAVLPTDDLASVVLVERTPGAHLLLAWSYPGLPSSAPAALRSVLLARTTFVEPTLSRFGKFCLYSVPVPAPSPSPSSSSPPPPLRALTLLSKSFAPERLLTLAQTLAQLYAASGAASPVPIQTAFLAALATSRVPRSLPNAPGPSSAVTRAAAASLAPDSVAWDAALFDPARTYRPAQGKATLTLVGVETVIVWTALMLRRRVAVYGPETAKVIRAARLLPLLVAHRFPAAAAGAGIALPAGYAVAAAGEEPAGAAALSSLIFPLVSLSDFPFTRGAGADGGDAENGGDGASSSSPNALSFDGPLGASLRADIDAAAQAQAEDLAAAGTYVAGFTDPAVLARGGDLWDVLVDLGARTVTVAETAKGEKTNGTENASSSALLRIVPDHFRSPRDPPLPPSPFPPPPSVRSRPRPLVRPQGGRQGPRGLPRGPVVDGRLPLCRRRRKIVRPRGPAVGVVPGRDPPRRRGGRRERLPGAHEAGGDPGGRRALPLGCRQR